MVMDVQRLSFRTCNRKHDEIASHQVNDSGALIIARHSLVHLAPGNEKCRHGERFLTY